MASDGSKLVFIIFADPTVADAIKNFAMFKLEFGDQGDVNVSGQGDEEYLDTHNNLHARKANIRYYLSLGLASGDAPTTVNDVKQLSAAVLAGL